MTLRHKLSFYMFGFPSFSSWACKTLPGCNPRTVMDIRFDPKELHILFGTTFSVVEFTLFKISFGPGQKLWPFSKNQNPFAQSPSTCTVRALPFLGTFLALHKLLNLIIRQLRHNALGGLGCLDRELSFPPPKSHLPWWPDAVSPTCGSDFPMASYQRSDAKMVTCGRLRLRKGIRKDPSSSRVIMSLTWNCILNIAGATSMMSCNRVISSSAAALLPAPAPGKRNCFWDSFLFVCDHSSWI